MSATTRHQVFTAVHTVGGLLPSDMLLRISEGKDVPGSKPADYGLPSSRSVRDEAERSWEYLKPLWRDLRKHLPEDRVTGQPASDPTGRAVADWLAPLWRELGFGRLTPLGTEGIAADSDSEKHFQVSHRWQHALIHQTPWNANLDKRPGGAGTVPPQSMLQECLNRTEAHLWGLLTNGRQVRLLRDSSALATASYVEFDLEAIFDGELFSEFVLLYRLLHVSRFEVAEDAAPSTCWLEKWRTEAVAQGTRALDQLRKGVQRAITTLGTGFLKHPANRELRETVDVKTFHYGLLRMVYRLLFLFVAEDREVLLSPSAEEHAKDRYKTYFSSARLRRHAHRRRGTAHGDLYRALRFVLSGLGNDDGLPELGLPGLGGIFDDTEADKVLHSLSLSNEPLLEAVRALSIVRDTTSKRNRVVDYRHLDAEELGSIYESLLELVPQHNATERTFELVELAGNARKTTGSYYTPSSLIECLLDSALDPVIDDAVKRGEIRATRSGEPDPGPAIVEELLSLTVCDPACGSGHFLVAAARRIAKRVAAVREQNPEPTIDAVRHALHEVVARCIYGVDLNPMAVELAKVSLWLEALEPGKPLGFLDAHIKHGNALVGATPALLAKGIPDDAFKPIEGDDKKVASAIKKRNAAERGGQLSFHTEERIWVSNAAFAASLRDITAARANTLRDVRLQSSRFRELEQSAEYIRALHIGDAWCAAFVWPKVQGGPTPVTEGVFRDLQSVGAGIPASTNNEIIRPAQQHEFFHWHLEFPEVFTAPHSGAHTRHTSSKAVGFDCIVGNPPWENIEFKEQEFFATRAPSISKASGSHRKTEIANLEDSNPEAFREYKNALRNLKSIPQFVSNSTLYPLYSRGMREVKGANRYKYEFLFLERSRALTSKFGRTGLLVPTGIATDAVTQFLFQDMVDHASIAALYDFENRTGLFPSVDSRMKFSILSVSGESLPQPASQFAFFLRDPAELDDAEKTFNLTPAELRLLSPNTGTCPVFRSRRDAEISVQAAQQFGPLRSKMSTGSYGLTIRRLFNLGMRDIQNLCTRGTGPHDGHTPMLESKMTHAYNHRYSTYSGNALGETHYGTIDQLEDPEWRNYGRYTIPKKELDAKISELWNREWILTWADVARNTDERTLISLIAPRVATDYTLRVGFTKDPSAAQFLLAIFNSHVGDYLLRLRQGGLHVSDYILEQLPVPKFEQLIPHRPFILNRILELTYNANDILPFARDLGDNSPPFMWNEGRRAAIRVELDAYFFHLYGITHKDADYILDTFPIIRRKEEAKYGNYRTKDLILAEYDRMAAAGVSLENPLVDGENYTSSLTPPPGHGPRHPAR
ncbi:Eco57I restriction-modification methylase domain-containing protein [Streptomyces tendae]|uniref:Eco57I restriction-modification methylase domain-containing protein n=1 Tax=Streptomyces tendae TaxID=1932 RepID=UPI00372086BF